MTTAPLAADAASISVSAYEVLRKGGAPPGMVRQDLKLTAMAAARLERIFRGRADRGLGDDALPRFARHADHVEAVMAQGGFPALSERRVGKHCFHLSLPLTRPGAARP